jgi:hypothetical protein
VGSECGAGGVVIDGRLFALTIVTAREDRFI